MVFKGSFITDFWCTDKDAVHQPETLMAMVMFKNVFRWHRSAQSRCKRRVFDVQKCPTGHLPQETDQLVLFLGGVYSCLGWTRERIVPSCYSRTSMRSRVFSLILGWNSENFSSSAQKTCRSSLLLSSRRPPRPDREPWRSGQNRWYFTLYSLCARICVVSFYTRA